MVLLAMMGFAFSSANARPLADGVDVFASPSFRVANHLSSRQESPLLHKIPVYHVSSMEPPPSPKTSDDLSSTARISTPPRNPPWEPPPSPKTTDDLSSQQESPLLNRIPVYHLYSPPPPPPKVVGDCFSPPPPSIPRGAIFFASPPPPSPKPASTGL
ncbi:hypothetical protein OIU79_011782 [Salix purpurea]|uniref:Uncharacterized protein n=1 Tax=Salix purpurea TaxID=77065 RepID=A0A9Q0Q1J4_SALPP|nr:hypothetical protein OIU79_011782 [Salix purpurea]